MYLDSVSKKEVKKLRQGQQVKNFDLNENLEINQRVEFEIRNGQYEGSYPTQVVDVIDDETFVINAPFSQGRVIRLSTNTRAHVFLRGKTALYSLAVKLVDKDFDSTHLFILEQVGPARKIQERRYFRLDIYEPIDFQLIGEQSDLEKFDGIMAEDFVENSDLDFAEIETKELSGIIDDISAGGVKIVTEHKLKLEQLLDLNLDFIGEEFAAVLGQVIRVNKIVKDNDKRYEIGVEFLGFGRSERDELMSWLFAKQRELRKKGLI